MRVRDAIALADELKPNAFSSAAKVLWLSEVEGMVQTSVFQLAPEEVISYTWERDADTELLVLPPHDKLYVEYLAARIDYANGEYDKYANTMQMFNAFWAEFVAWFANTYRPADTHGASYDLGLELRAEEFERGRY